MSAGQKSSVIMNKKKNYQSPVTNKVRVCSESGVCAASKTKVTKITEEKVQVDEWDSIESGVTFD